MAAKTCSCTPSEEAALSNQLRFGLCELATFPRTSRLGISDYLCEASVRYSERFPKTAASAGHRRESRSLPPGRGSPPGTERPSGGDRDGGPRLRRDRPRERDRTAGAEAYAGIASAGNSRPARRGWRRSQQLGQSPWVLGIGFPLVALPHVVRSGRTARNRAVGSRFPAHPGDRFHRAAGTEAPPGSASRSVLDQRFRVRSARNGRHWVGLRVRDV